MRKFTLLWTLLISVNTHISVEGCTSVQFECNNGECIPADQRCDDFFDCTDLSDEQNCTTVIVCPEGQYRCADGECANLCDGIDQCNDGADEYNCEPEPQISLNILTLSDIMSMSKLSYLSNQPSDLKLTTVHVEPTQVTSIESGFTSDMSNLSTSKDTYNLTSMNVLSSANRTLLPTDIQDFITTARSVSSFLDIYSFESNFSTSFSKTLQSIGLTTSIYLYVTSEPYISSIYSTSAFLYDTKEKSTLHTSFPDSPRLSTLEYILSTPVLTTSMFQQKINTSYIASSMDSPYSPLALFSSSLRQYTVYSLLKSFLVSSSHISPEFSITTNEIVVTPYLSTSVGELLSASVTIKQSEYLPNVSWSFPIDISMSTSAKGFASSSHNIKESVQMVESSSLLKPTLSKPSSTISTIHGQNSTFVTKYLDVQTSYIVNTSIESPSFYLYTSDYSANLYTFKVKEKSTLVTSISTVQRSTFKLEFSNIYEPYVANTSMSFTPSTVLYSSINPPSVFVYSTQYSSDSNVFNYSNTSTVWLERSVVQNSTIEMESSDIHESNVRNETMSVSLTDSVFAYLSDSHKSTTLQVSSILTTGTLSSVMSTRSGKGAPKSTSDISQSMDILSPSFRQDPSLLFYDSSGEYISTSDVVIKHMSSTTTVQFLPQSQNIRELTDIPKMSSFLSEELTPSYIQYTMSHLYKMSSYTNDISKSYGVNYAMSFQSLPTELTYSLSPPTSYFHSSKYSSDSYESSSSTQVYSSSFNSLETFSSFLEAIVGWQNNTPSLYNTATHRNLSTDEFSQTEEKFPSSLKQFYFDTTSYKSKHLSTDQNFVRGSSSTLYFGLLGRQSTHADQFSPALELTQSVYMSVDVSVIPTITTERTPPDNTKEADFLFLLLLICLLLALVLLWICVVLRINRQKTPKTGNQIPMTKNRSVENFHETNLFKKVLKPAKRRVSIQWSTKSFDHLPDVEECSV